MIRLLTLVAALLVAAAAPVSAGDVNGFDVLGIRVGMTADEVESVAASKGLRKEGETPAPSFDQAITLQNGRHVPAMNYAGVKTLKFADADESLEVRFAQMPDGSRVRQIIYTVLGGLDREQMTARVLEKYGPPANEVMGRAVWGDTALPFSRKSAWLEYDDSPPAAHGRKPVGALTLSDPAFHRQAKEAIETAAGRS